MRVGGTSFSSSSSNPGERSDGPPASLREALRAGVLEYWSIAIVGIAPGVRGVRSASRAIARGRVRRAEALGYGLKPIIAHSHPS
jgi:hypothetical protein